MRNNFSFQTSGTGGHLQLVFLLWGRGGQCIPKDLSMFGSSMQDFWKTLGIFFLPQKYWHLHNCLGLRILLNTSVFSPERTYSKILPLQFRTRTGEAQMPCLSCACLKLTAGTEVNSEALVRCQEVLTQCTSSILQYLHCVNILTAGFDGRQNTFFHCL